jgi:hypothetical protein
VGRYEESVNSDNVPLLLELAGGSWEVKDVMPGLSSAAELFAVDCPTGASCVAVGEHVSVGDTDPLAVTGPGTWALNATVPLPDTHEPTDPEARLREVACSAAGTCLAAGSFRTDDGEQHGLVERLSAGTWAATDVAAPPTGASDDPLVSFNAVACSSTCAAVGQFLADAGGFRPLLFRSGTAPEATQGAVPGDPAGLLDSGSTTVTCASGGRCVAVGYYDDGVGIRTPLMSTLNAGAWTASSGPTPDDASGLLEPRSSAVDGTVAVSVGYYQDGEGDQRPLIMLDLPLAAP